MNGPSSHSGKEAEMHILFPTDKDEFLEAVYSVSSWDIAFPTEDIAFRNDIHAADYYLGNSKDKKTWVLASMPYQDDDDSDKLTQEAMVSACAVALVDPPLVREESILRILFLVFYEKNEAGEISTDRIEEIFQLIPFKEYLLAEKHLPEIPEAWRNLPVEVCVDFELADGAGINHRTFREFSRDSLKDALEVVCSPRHDGFLIQYVIAVRGAIPLLEWDVDWPLARRGKTPPERRKKVQGPAPWDYEADSEILSVYQHMEWVSNRIWSIPYFGEPIVRLRVGGRTQEEAISNWHRCAKALRKWRREFSAQVSSEKENVPVEESKPEINTSSSTTPKVIRRGENLNMTQASPDDPIYDLGCVIQTRNTGTSPGTRRPSSMPGPPGPPISTEDALKDKPQWMKDFVMKQLPIEVYEQMSGDYSSEETTDESTSSTGGGKKV